MLIRCAVLRRWVRGSGEGGGKAEARAGRDKRSMHRSRCKSKCAAEQSANSHLSCTLFHTCRSQLVEELQFLAFGAVGRFLKCYTRANRMVRTGFSSKLPSTPIQGCKLTRDASEDSRFRGWRRIPAMELCLLKLSFPARWHVPWKAAQPDPDCNDRRRTLVVFSRCIS
jgi:hypothetical protein